MSKELEDAEFEESMTALLENPHFIRVLVQNYVETRPEGTSPLAEQDILIHNYNQGLHAWSYQIVEHLRFHKHAAYFNFINEVHAYEYRRRDAVRRDDERTTAEFQH